MITDDQITESVSLAADCIKGEITPEMVADHARQTHIDGEECANYSDVCDLWGAKLPYDMAATPLVNRQRVADLKAADWQTFVARVAKIMESSK
jgi:hypothetical protein